MDLSWLNNLIEALLSFIPRLVIIRATHEGCKWRYGKKVIEMKPGIHWVWPLMTEYEVIVVARQTHQVAEVQHIESLDGVPLAVSALVVYSINDVVKAIGQKNYDVDSTINDITESAVVHTFSEHDYKYLQMSLCTKIEETLTDICKRELSKYGVLVQQARITGFCRAEMKMLLGMSNYVAASEE